MLVMLCSTWVQLLCIYLALTPLKQSFHLIANEYPIYTNDRMSAIEPIEPLLALTEGPHRDRRNGYQWCVSHRPRTASDSAWEWSSYSRVESLICRHYSIYSLAFIQIWFTEILMIGPSFGYLSVDSAPEMMVTRAPGWVRTRAWPFDNGI